MVAECEFHEMVVTGPVRRELRLLSSSRRACSSFCRCRCEVRVVVVIRLANRAPQESVERFFADDQIPRSVFPAPGERDQAMIITPVLQARWQFERGMVVCESATEVPGGCGSRSCGQRGRRIASQAARMISTS